MSEQTNNNTGTESSNQNPISTTTPPVIPSGPDFRTLTECFSVNAGANIKDNKTSD